MGMNIKNILRLGYFDRIKVDAELKPIIKSEGIEIRSNLSFINSAELSTESHKYGFAQLKISIIGECDTNISFLELERMRDDRSSNNLIKLQSNRLVDKYLIAYADLILLKSGYSLPSHLGENGKTEYDIEKLAKSGDMLDLMLSALEFQRLIIEKHPDSKGLVAIVNKVYVTQLFRRNGISTYIHKNMADLINLYAMMFPSGIVLTYGDFAGEAKLMFNMSRQAYTKMLIRHYKDLGYKSKHSIGLGINNSLSTDLLYKIID